MYKLIAFCGIDGAGKSTTIQKVKHELMQMGYKVKVMKAVLNSQILLRKIAEKYYGDQDHFIFYFPALYVRIGVAFDFATYYMQNNDFEEYDYILCDRYDICYKAYGDSFGVSDMSFPNMLFSMAPKVDKYIYFDITAEQAVRRIEKRGEEIIDNGTLPFLKKVLESYRKNINELQNLLVVDTRKILDEVTKEIIEYII